MRVRAISSETARRTVAKFCIPTHADGVFDMGWVFFR